MVARIAPKLFISYSWSSRDHESWVVNLAEELASQGIHVILDKWDLQPGHDAHAFMESMVTDPTVSKVVLVCDKKYTEKSNNRSGGAGTEAQIITPKLYTKKAQDKFVAVVRECDESGNPYLPVYYGGRIYIDLSNAANYATEFDRLVRWAWDQPLYIRPDLGTKPSFLSADQPKKIATSVPFRRAFDAVKADRSNAVAFVSEYLSALSKGLEAFRIERSVDDTNPFDDTVIANVEEFVLFRNEAIEIFTVVAQYKCTDEMVLSVHRFFESIIPYLDRPKHVNTWNDTDFDNFKFIVNELFLYAIAVFLKYEKFSAAAYLIDNIYYWDDVNNSDDNMKLFTIFSTNVKSLSIRNRRLKLGRLSLQADMLNERSKGTGIDFNYIMAADFVLYLRGILTENWPTWWPETLVYTGRFAGAFEMFARARSSRYFDRIKSLIGVSDKQALGKVIEKINRNPNSAPRWQFQRVNIGRLSGFDALATMP